MRQTDSFQLDFTCNYGNGLDQDGTGSFEVVMAGSAGALVDTYKANVTIAGDNQYSGFGSEWNGRWNIFGLLWTIFDQNNNF